MVGAFCMWLFQSVLGCESLFETHTHAFNLDYVRIFIMADAEKYLSIIEYGASEELSGHCSSWIVPDSSLV